MWIWKKYKWKIYRYYTKKLNYGRPVEEFFCISSKNGNLSLFYEPNIGYSLINLRIIIKDISIYSPENIGSIIVTENNIKDHNSKRKPINENFIYHKTTSFHSIEFISILYDIQFLKYESDDSFFLNKNINFSGITFNSMSSKRNAMKTYNLTNDIKYMNLSNIEAITFSINQANFDNCKRSYKKLQSLLAEVMSVLNIIFEIGRQILFFLCHKKMSKDIMRYILYKDKKNISIEQSRNITLMKDKSYNKISSEKETKNEFMNKINNTENPEKKANNINIHI